MPIVSRFNLPAQIDNLLLKLDLTDCYQFVSVNLSANWGEVERSLSTWSRFNWVKSFATDVAFEVYFVISR